MKKYLSIFTAFLALTATGYASADEGFYVGVDGGGNWVDKSHADFDAGWVVAGQLGYKFCNNFRLEAEVGYRRNQVRKAHSRQYFDSVSGQSWYSHDKGHLRTWSYMANLLYDFDGYFDCWCITPYVGAGIGYVNQKFQTHGHDNYASTFNTSATWDSGSHHRKEKNGFAWDIIAGISYPISCNLDLDVRYQYLNGKGSFNNNAVEAGLRYFF